MSKEELPTAATVGKHAHIKEGSYQITNSITVPPEIGHLEEGDELVRRKDVEEKLIEAQKEADLDSQTLTYLAFKLLGEEKSKEIFCKELSQAVSKSVEQRSDEVDNQ